MAPERPGILVWVSGKPPMASNAGGNALAKSAPSVPGRGIFPPEGVPEPKCPRLWMAQIFQGPWHGPRAPWLLDMAHTNRVNSGDNLITTKIMGAMAMAVGQPTNGHSPRRVATTRCHVELQGWR